MEGAIVLEKDSSVRYADMAGPTGIEPATYGLRVRCSTLLSYGPTVFP